MKHFHDIIKSFTVGMFVWILTTVIFPLVVVFYKRNSNTEIQVNIIILMLSISMVSVLLFIFYYKKVSLVKTVLGREEAMKSNLKLLNKINYPHEYILSTRIGHWPISERSEYRDKFRAAYTKYIKRGIKLKRLWQISSAEDLVRLEHYLNLYKEFDNFYVKCVVGSIHSLPEILSCNGKVVTVSIPQQNNPRKMTLTFQYFKKSHIRYWEDYFNLIWDSAITIKIGNNLYYKNLEIIRKELETEANKSYDDHSG